MGVKLDLNGGMMIGWSRPHVKLEFRGAGGESLSL